MSSRPTSVVDQFQIDPTVYIAPHVYLSGTITIGPHSSIWPMSVIRADECEVTIGAYCNIQDGCIIHGDPGYPVLLEDRVALGHGAIVHGAVIERESLIGIGAVVLTGARIGRGSLIAARALVPEHAVIPPGSLVVGIPGRARPITAAQSARIASAVEEYARLKELYRQRDQRTGDEHG